MDIQIAALLGTTRDRIRVKDLAVHPQTKEAYIAVSRATGDTYQSTVVIVNQTGKVRVLKVPKTAARIHVSGTPATTPKNDFTFYGRVSARSLTFTDLDFHKGKLYISGLSNADFAASLWVADYPFNGKSSMTTVEIYHTTHGQQETRAPIRTMTIAELNGVDHVIAAYTCTPLATFPLSEIKDGAHINGKVIAELGYGNTPVDLLQYDATNFQTNEKYPVLALTNKNRSGQVIAIEAVAEAAKGDGLTTPKYLVKAALGAQDIPLTGLMQAAEQNDAFLVGIRRNADNGNLELVSIMKNMYLRISDFESEFDFPTFKYSKEQEKLWRSRHNAMKKSEGVGQFAK